MFIGQIFVANDTQAISTALAPWRERYPQLGLLALLPEAEQARLPSLQELCRELDQPLLGAVFPALIRDNAFLGEGICLIGLEVMPPHFLLGGLDELGGEKLGEATLQLLDELPPTQTPPSLFFIFDGMLPNISSMLNVLHNLIGDRATCSGVNAGSERFQPMPCLFDENRLLGQGVLGLLLDDTPGIAVKHGYPVSKSLMNATSTAGNQIHTLNNRPAFAVYQEVIAAEYGVTLTRENFYDHAVHFPFGLVTVLDVLVRIPVGFTDSGTLLCVGEIPPNALLKLLRAPAFEHSHCVHEIRQALAASGKSPLGKPLLTFYCAGRRMHFGEQAAHELATLQAETGATQLFGALTLGEIDCIEELNLLPRFHNAALVCVRF